MSNCSIWLKNGALSGTTIQSQSEPGSNVNEGLIHISQSLTIEGWVPYPRHSFLRGRILPSAKILSAYSTAPAESDGYLPKTLTKFVISVMSSCTHDFEIENFYLFVFKERGSRRIIWICGRSIFSIRGIMGRALSINCNLLTLRVKQLQKLSYQINLPAAVSIASSFPQIISFFSHDSFSLFYSILFFIFRSLFDHFMSKSIFSFLS